MHVIRSLFGYRLPDQPFEKQNSYSDEEVQALTFVARKRNNVFFRVSIPPDPRYIFARVGC